MEDRFTNRLRFSYAHELGHLFLHKDFYSTFPIDSLEDWKNFTLTVPDREYGFVEYQANEFAGRLLVPRDSLITELGKCIVQIKESGLSKFLSDNPHLVLAGISPALGRLFGVSDQVIERRVEREGFWPPENKFPGERGA
jgi:Zn-dependent peptidase ImmA (M78 family)